MGQSASGQRRAGRCCFLVGSLFGHWRTVLSFEPVLSFWTEPVLSLFIEEDGWPIRGSEGSFPAFSVVRTSPATNSGPLLADVCCKSGWTHQFHLSWLLLTSGKLFKSFLWPLSLECEVWETWDCQLLFTFISHPGLSAVCFFNKDGMFVWPLFCPLYVFKGGWDGAWSDQGGWKVTFILLTTIGEFKAFRSN